MICGVEREAITPKGAIGVSAMRPEGLTRKRRADPRFSRLDRDATPRRWLTRSRFWAGGRGGFWGARVWWRAGGRVLGGWVGEERRDVLQRVVRGGGTSRWGMNEAQQEN